MFTQRGEVCNERNFVYFSSRSVIVNWTACYCNFMVDLVPWLKAKDKQV